MSLLLTKPRYFPTAIATNSGWINPVTKELLVSVGNLKSRLEAEEKDNVVEIVEVVEPEVIIPEVIIEIAEPEVIIPVVEPEVIIPDVIPEVIIEIAEPEVIIPVVEPEVIIEKESPMIIEPVSEQKQRKPYTLKKSKIINEVTEQKLRPGTQLLGEVVEYNIDTKIIGE